MSAVTVYEHGNYRGKSANFNEGRWNFDTVNRVIGNDKISSVRVKPGYEVTLYDNANFGGRSQKFRNSVPGVGKLNDKTSSLIVKKIEVGTITTYEHPNFTGKFSDFNEGRHNNLGEVGNDSISSIKFNKPGYEVVLYEHSNFGGKAKRISSSIGNLRDVEFQDKTSSLIVRKKEGVGIITAYEHGDFKGEFSQFNEGEHNNLKEVGNDRISSIRINKPGYEVVLYEHGNFGGKSKIVSRTINNLREIGFPDKTSSLIVRKIVKKPVVKKPVVKKDSPVEKEEVTLEKRLEELKQQRSYHQKLAKYNSKSAAALKQINGEIAKIEKELGIKKEEKKIIKSVQKQKKSVENNNSLQLGESMFPGDKLVSKNGKYMLIFQKNGNFVIYDKKKPIWRSNTTGKNGNKIVFNSRTKIISMFNSKNRFKTIWKIEEKGDTLIMENSGNVVLYNNGKEVWSTNTKSREERNKEEVKILKKPSNRNLSQKVSEKISIAKKKVGDKKKDKDTDEDKDCCCCDKTKENFVEKENYDDYLQIGKITNKEVVFKIAIITMLTILMLMVFSMIKKGNLTIFYYLIGIAILVGLSRLVMVIL